MSRVLCLLLCVSSFAFTQTSNQTQNSGSSGSSVVQVVDVINGSALTTYNVDPETFEATEIGAITINQSNSPTLITSPTGRFLYYFADQGYLETANTLYVYDTNASGLPGTTAVQSMGASRLAAWAMHPSGKFLYTAEQGNVNSQFILSYAVVRRLINEKDGTLSHPVTAATYEVDAYPSGNDCNLLILGFNPSGTTMYDAVSCNAPHGTSSETYYASPVNLQTGAVGPQQQIYTWNYYAGSGYETVQFANNLMFDFGTTEFPPTSWVDIYRVAPNVTTPLVNCTSSMWAICGDYELEPLPLVHPSGKYVFLAQYDSSVTTYIGKVNYTTDEITQTSLIPYGVGQFSPDGTIVYANGSTDIEIYGFNLASGQVVQGGTIGGLASYPTPGTYLATERY